MSWWQVLLSYGGSICVVDFFLIKFYEPTRLLRKRKDVILRWAQLSSFRRLSR